MLKNDEDSVDFGGVKIYEYPSEVEDTSAAPTINPMAVTNYSVLHGTDDIEVKSISGARAATLRSKQLSMTQNFKKTFPKRKSVISSKNSSRKPFALPREQNTDLLAVEAATEIKTLNSPFRRVIVKDHVKEMEEVKKLKEL